jgi:uncharacterized RDD family membrane protein YckC
MSSPEARKPRIGFWLRVLSALVDLLVLYACWLVLGLLWPTLYDMGLSLAGVESIFLLVYFFYSINEIIWAATPGKMLFRQRIGRADGERADGWRMFLRWSVKQSPPMFYIIFGITGFSIFYLLGGFGLLVILIGCLYASTDEKQTWHDQWAGTAVYRRRDLARAAGVSA